MCGIAGLVTVPNKPIDLRERLIAMRDMMAHRGPDDSGLYIAADGRAGLANRRLAIRDLSPAGHMPMLNAAGTVCVTHNGEVYDIDQTRIELERLGYSFNSHSDTEVILHGYEAWGEGVVQKLRGMFAFAILDLRQQPGRLFIARDRLGIKPLYYSYSSGCFLFASELKGILASGLASHDLNPDGLLGYLQFGSVPNPLTLYRDIRALEPGCTLTVLLDDLSASPRSVPYWSLPTGLRALPDPVQIVEQVRGLLEESVRIRLVSDVPLGAFLSGGLDSSAVVALMRQATNGTIRTCSMVFEESEYSESVYARAMANHVEAEHFERTITSGDVLKNFDHILWAMDQPSVDGLNTYFVSQTAREAGLTVSLSGLGGDELFGGYANTFQGVPQMLRLLSLARAIPLGAAFTRTAIDLLPDRYRLTRLAEALTRPPSLANAYMTRRGLFSLAEIRKLVQADVWQSAAGFDSVGHVASLANNHHDEQSAFAWVSRAELRTYTHQQLLRDTDVMSMAHSLEVRVPLLDHHLVELVLQLPPSTKVNGGTPKPLLLKAVSDLLPASVRERRDKQGFVFPLDRWFRSTLQPRMQELLYTTGLSNYLRHDAIDIIWRDYQAGHQHWSRVWALAALNGWLSQSPVSAN